MRKNTTLSRLRDGKVALGSWLQLHSYQASRMLAAQGFFEWLLVDFEHTPVDRSGAAQILATIADVSGGRVTPLARVAAGSVEEIKHALDAGAQGVIVPMIKSAAEVRAAVRYARYPPDGERGAGGLSPHLGFGVSRPVYIQSVNREILFGVQIETAEAVEDIEAILDVRGVDLCFIGPNDLHLALGYPAMFWSSEPRFAQAIERVRAACARRGIPMGTLCKDVASAKDRIREGYTFVGLGSDAHFVLQYAGLQYGELHGISEPPETWCNAMKFHDGPYHGAAAPQPAAPQPAAPAPAAPAPAAPAPAAPTPAAPAPAVTLGPTLGGDPRIARIARHVGASEPLPRSFFQTREFKFDPNAPEFDLDPFPTYKYMRENVPVYWWAEAQGWVCTRYQDVLTLLRDRRFSVELKDWEHGPADQPDERLTTHQVLAKHGLFWMAATDHMRVRKVLGPLFSPRAVEPLRRDFDAVAEEMLAPLEGRGSFDLVADFTSKYPLRAITRVLGIPREQHERFIQFGSAVIDAFYPAISPEALREKMAFLPTGVAMLEEIMAEKRQRPDAGFFSKLVHAEEQGERLTEKEVISQVALMISAGCEPPRHLVTFAIRDLLMHPEQLALLRADPGLLRNAIDEVGRFDSFGKLNLPRFPLEDVEISGVRIPRGQQVFGVFASALRDPEVFLDPDVFDIRRDQIKSVLYGDGPHVCLGTWLAKLMAESAVRALLRTFPSLALAGPPAFTRNAFFRKIVSLPLERA
jgi:cytochrome P450/2-keto-3-deoxy-L-rhamnonate aldolase RhmA